MTNETTKVIENVFEKLNMEPVYENGCIVIGPENLRTAFDFIRADERKKMNYEHTNPTPAHQKQGMTEGINELFIENVCLSYRHDFGLLKPEEQERIRFECREWIRAYENNKPSSLYIGVDLGHPSGDRHVESTIPTQKQGMTEADFEKAKQGAEIEKTMEDRRG